MEKWNIFDENIYFDDYFEIKMSFSEEDNLKISMFDENRIIMVDFGCVCGFRVLDEGLVQNGVYFNDEELQKLKQTKFRNAIYILEDGEFGYYMLNTAGGFLVQFEIYHFVVISPNFNIDIVTRHMPVSVSIK